MTKCRNEEVKILSHQVHIFKLQACRVFLIRNSFISLI